MSGFRGLGLVIGREVRESARRRSLWVTVVLAFLGSLALVVVPSILRGDDSRSVAVFGSAPDSFGGALAAAAIGDVEIETVGRPAELRNALRGDKIDAAVDFSARPPNVLVRSVDDDQWGATVEQVVARTSLQATLLERGVTADQLDAALATARPTIDEVEPDRGGRSTVAFIASLALYLLLLMLTTSVASGIAIEKSKRISEVLLAIVRPPTLLYGKVIGVGLIGLATLAAGALPIAAKLLIGGDLPPGTGTTLVASAAWFVLGIALYLSVAGGLGALVDRQEQVGSVVAPLSLILVAAYLAGVSVADSTLGALLAIVPLTSPMVMPARLALGEAGAAEVVASLMVLIATVAISARISTVIYERAIVRTGRKLTVREVLRPTRSGSGGEL